MSTTRSRAGPGSRWESNHSRRSDACEVGLVAEEVGHRIEALREEGDRTATVGETHVEVGVAVEDTTEHERRRGEGLLVRVADDEVESEPSQSGVGHRPTSVVRDTVDEERHVELDDSAVEVVESPIVGRHPVVGADVAGDESEIADRSVELDDRCVGVLHRELRRTEQPLRMRRDQRGHRIVGRPCEVDRRCRLDTTQERERDSATAAAGRCRRGPSRRVGVRRP